MPRILLNLSATWSSSLPSYLLFIKKLENQFSVASLKSRVAANINLIKRKHAAEMSINDSEHKKQR